MSFFITIIIWGLPYLFSFSYLELIHSFLKSYIHLNEAGMRMLTWLFKNNRKNMIMNSVIWTMEQMSYWWFVHVWGDWLMHMRKS